MNFLLELLRGVPERTDLARVAVADHERLRNHIEKTADGQCA